jgi:hypothetical protein
MKTMTFCRCRKFLAIQPYQKSIANFRETIPLSRYKNIYNLASIIKRKIYLSAGTTLFCESFNNNCFMIEIFRYKNNLCNCVYFSKNISRNWNAKKELKNIGKKQRKHILPVCLFTVP